MKSVIKRFFALWVALLLVFALAACDPGGAEKSKDGEVKVNGRVEYARRRVLEIGDKVSFDGKHYIIAEDRDGDRPAVKPRRRMLPTDEGFDGVREHVQHKQKPLQWTEKKIKKKEKS